MSSAALAMRGAETILDVSDMVVSFGGIRAVNGVSFSVRKGEILGLIGPNGAGKTTIFDALSGFVAARGKIVLEGRDITRLNPEGRSRARLGRSFQDAKLFPSLTVFETLAVAFERHGRASDLVSTAVGAPWVRSRERRVAKKAEDLIELFGLGAFRDKFVSELSTGSRRIVDLAAIQAHDPVVLLLDEPSSGIAQRETEALGPLLTRVRDEAGTTILVIEHDMPLITAISDEILALNLGEVMLRGTPAEVMDDPQLVSAYLGTDHSIVQRSGTRSVTNDLKTAKTAKTAKTTKAAKTTKTTKTTRKAAAKTTKSTPRTSRSDS